MSASLSTSPARMGTHACRGFLSGFLLYHKTLSARYAMNTHQMCLLKGWNLYWVLGMQFAIMDLRAVYFIMTLVYIFEEIAQLAKKLRTFSYTLVRKLRQFKPLKLGVTEYWCTLLAEIFFLFSFSLVYTMLCCIILYYTIHTILYIMSFIMSFPYMYNSHHFLPLLTFVDSLSFFNEFN